MILFVVLTKNFLGGILKMKRVIALLCLLSVAVLGRSEEPLRADIVVVGGDEAGFAAAWSAAKLGSSVILIEKEASLGISSLLKGRNYWAPGYGATGLPYLLFRRLKAEGTGRVGLVLNEPPEAFRGKSLPGSFMRYSETLPYWKSLLGYSDPGMKDPAWFREAHLGVAIEPGLLPELMGKMLGESGKVRVLLNTSFEGFSREGKRIHSLTLKDGRRVETRIVIDTAGAVCKAMGCGILEGAEPRSRFNEAGAPEKPQARPGNATLVYRVIPRKSGEGIDPLPEGMNSVQEPLRRALFVASPKGGIDIRMEAVLSGKEILALPGEAAHAEARKRALLHWRGLQSACPPFRRYTLQKIFPRLDLGESFRVETEAILNQNNLAGSGKERNPDGGIAWVDNGIDIQGKGIIKGLARPYPIPYFCLLPKGSENLLVAGRHAGFSAIAASSCTHPRTLIQLGEAAGVAAHLALSKNISLRKVPAREIREVMEKSIDANPYRERKYRLIMADEPRGKIHLVDLGNPKNSFSLSVPRPVGDLKKCGKNLYRSVGGSGFTVVDIKKRKVVDRFKHPLLKQIYGLCELPDGGFLALVNTNKKRIDIHEFSAKRQFVRTLSLPGYIKTRSSIRLQNGELLITHNTGILRVAIPKTGNKPRILQSIKQLRGSNPYGIALDPDSNGIWVGNGLGRQLVHYGVDGTPLSAWEAYPPAPIRTRFFGIPFPLPNGNWLVGNWTGHTWSSSKNAWQVMEFDKCGHVVWYLFDPVAYGSIVAVRLLDSDEGTL